MATSAQKAQRALLEAPGTAGAGPSVPGSCEDSPKAGCWTPATRFTCHLPGAPEGTAPSESGLCLTDHLT